MYYTRFAKYLFRPPSQVKSPLLTLSPRYASVAELVDALDLGSSGATRGGSIPFARTIT